MAAPRTTYFPLPRELREKILTYALVELMCSMVFGVKNRGYIALIYGVSPGVLTRRNERRRNCLDAKPLAAA